MRRDIPISILTCCPHCGGANLRLWAEARDFLLDTTDQTFSYARCSACKLLFLTTRPEEQSLGTIYPDEYSPHQQGSVAPKTVRANALIRASARLIEFPERLFSRQINAYYSGLGHGDLFLDFGCGSGKALNRMRAKGCATIGMDFAERALSAVQSSGHVALRPDRDGWSRIQEGTVNFVRMNHALEHLYHPREVLEQLHRKLRAGGVIHVAVPNPNGISARLYGKYWHGLDCPRHVILFPPRLLADWLKDLGFNVLKVLYEPLTKDLIRSHARKQAQGLADAPELDALIKRRRHQALAFLPSVIGTLLGWPDRFHIIACR